MEVDWFRWPILCIRSSAVPPLDRVIVVDAGGRSPTVIPHGKHITLDCKVEGLVEQVHSPDATQSDTWRQLNMSRAGDHDIIEAARERFPPIARLSHKKLVENTFTFVGIQGRRRYDNPYRLSGGSKSEVYTQSITDRHLVVIGGQASTALLDAVEVIDYMWQRDMCSTATRERLVALLADSIPDDPSDPEVGMIWEKVAGTGYSRP